MPKLAELGLTAEKVGQQDLDYATMPDQMGGTFAEPPQPGDYRFKMPARMDDLWDTFDVNGSNPGKRLAAVHDSAHPLTIIQSPKKAHDGEPFECRITNAERKRGKKDDPTAPEISDMDYLFRDAFGITKKPVSNPAYAQEYQKHANAEFGAAIDWNWYCNDQKDIRVDNGQGGVTEVPGQKGCNSRYYIRDVDKVLSNPADPTSPKVYPFRVTCQCGASLRAFANLARFKP